MSSTPIVVGGVVYIQDMRSNVEAHDLRSGALRWKRTYDDPSVGPNGLAYAGGLLYGATESFAFALNPRTGEQRWRSRRLPRNDREGIDMAPGVHDGTVFVSTIPGNFSSFYKGGGAGVLWALNARTGRPRWRFRTVPFSLWGNVGVNSGGGLWNPPGFDGRHGIYLNIGNPGPTNGGGRGNRGARSRPGPNLYTNSIVKLDERTGRRLWHYQVVPHDLYDWDSQIPPIYNRARNRVYIAGKYGRVLAFDARTGRKVWDTPVGIHNGHDSDNLDALHRRYSDLPDLPFTLLPGEAGGVETPMAMKGGVLYVPVVNVPYRMLKNGNSTANFQRGTGEMVALSASTGRRLWRRRVTSPVFGAATVVNDLVLSTDYAGSVFALDRRTGATAWRARLSSGTNAQVVIAGDTLITAASAPQPGQIAKIIAFRIDADGPVDDPPPAGVTPGTGATIEDGGGIGVGQSPMSW